MKSPLLRWLLLGSMFAMTGHSMAAPLGAPALAAGENVIRQSGEIAVPGLGTPTVVRYTWRDSGGQPRSVSLIPASGTTAGYAVQMTYVSPTSTIVYVNASPDGDGGFGYFVSHELYRTFTNGAEGTIGALFHGEDDSPLGRYLPSTGSDFSVAANQAVHEFRLTYGRWGTTAAIPFPDGVTVSAAPADHTRYTLPVVIRWTFIAGRDYPLWSVDYDVSSGADHIATDVRGPYGVMDFNEGVSPKVTGVRWGDRYKFSADSGSADFGPAASSANGVGWTWNTVNNGRRYNVLSAGAYEFGLVDTRTAPNSKYGDGYSDPSHRGNVKAPGQSCDYSMLAMPCDYEWAYQSFQYDYSPTRPKLAWGSSPFLGTSYTEVYDGTQNVPLVGAKGRISYGLHIVLAKNGTGAPKTLALAASAVEADVQLTVPAPTASGNVSFTVLGDSGGPYTANRTLPSFSSVRLTANPAAGFQFASWGGDCAGVGGNVCMLAMNAAKSVTATFTAAGAGVALAVNAGASRKPINDDIYGMNFATEALAANLRLPVRRWGGNSTTRYNYLIDVHNTAGDYYYENIPDGNSTTLPNDSTADRFVDQDRRTATRTIMTMPLIGYVPKRRLATHPYDCAFKVSKYGAQTSTDPFDVDCGNGIRSSNGQPITGNDPLDTSIAITPAFVTGWVNHLKARYGAASAGGVAYYNLDNEPGLWNSTHRDIFPNGLTYDGLKQRTIDYAKAIKNADPTAMTLGPAEWGWCSYFYSPADPGGCGPGTDMANHGNLPRVVWYLQQLKAEHDTSGVRLLDYLDLHFYPQGNGIALQPAGSAATQALRLRSTRALWDPTYEDESYIRDLATGAFLRMIPRMKEWVATHYPGTRTAITEYNWGAPESINGALAQAEVLGIFGREGLDLATLWDPPSTNQPLAFAFRMYRNYDGAGKGFGETSIQATSADPNNLSIFAAQRASDGALTLMILNKTGGDIAANVTLSGVTAGSTAKLYRYSNAALGSIQNLPDQAIAGNAFGATYPANSITLVVVPLPAVANPAGDDDSDGIPNGVEPQEGRNPNVKDNDVFADARLFAMQQYRDFLGREGDAGGITFQTNAINGGTSRAQVIENFFSSPEFSGVVAPVTRLYFAFFSRIPDYPGLQFQVNAFRAGTPLAVIANNFAASPEFQATYGNKTNTEYVQLLYANVLGRVASQGEIDFHVDRLVSGTSRGEVMVGFSESPEYRNLKFNAVYVTNMYVGMLRRAPEQAGFDFWVTYMTQGNSGQALIAGFLNAPEYRNRFLP